MADNYGELAELGFEGVDRFAAKFHDSCHEYVTKKRPHWHDKKKGKQARDHKDGSDRSPPPQHGRYDSPEDRNRGDYRSVYKDDDRSLHRDEDRSVYRDNDKHHQDRRLPSEDEDQSDMYAPDRRRDDRAYAGQGDGGFNDPGAMVVRRRDPAAYAGGYQVAPLVPPVPMAYPPPPFGGPYEDKFGYERRRPLPPQRRESSYSPPRRAEKRRSFSPPRRQRSKSPNHHRVAATIVGALAGSVIGNAASEKTGKGGKWSAIGGAIVGGLGGRELEKAYDRRKGNSMEEEERRERRRRRERS